MSVLLLCVIICTAAEAFTTESSDTSAKQRCSAGESFQQSLSQGSVRSFLQHASGNQGQAPLDKKWQHSSSYKEQVELFDVGTLQHDSSQQSQVQSDVKNTITEDAIVQEHAMQNEKKNEIVQFQDFTKWGRASTMLQKIKMHPHAAHNGTSQNVVKFHEVARGEQSSRSIAKGAHDSENAQMRKHAKQNATNREVVQERIKGKQASKYAPNQTKDIEDALIHDVAAQSEGTNEAGKSHKLTKRKHISKNASKGAKDIEDAKIYEHTKQNGDKAKYQKAARGKQTSSSDAKQKKKKEQTLKFPKVARGKQTRISAVKDARQDAKIDEPARQKEKRRHAVKSQKVAKTHRASTNSSKEVRNMENAKIHKTAIHFKATEEVKAKPRANQSKPHKKIGKLGKSVVEQAVATDTAVVWVMIIIMVIFVAWLLYCKHKETTTSEEIGPEHHSLYELNAQGKIHVYQGKKLLTWGMLLTRTLSIVLSWRVWAVVPCVVCVAWGIATLIITQLPYANQMDMKRMDSFAGYLRVFIAFMLGLYMNTSFQRWWHVVTSLKMIMSSFKQLIWTLNLMNLKRQLTDDIERKCVVECYILEAEMHTDLSMTEDDCTGHFEDTWKLLINEGLLTEKEVTRITKGINEDHLITNIGARSSLMMSWIGHSISRISEEPGVLTPMYVRLVSLIHSAMSHAEDLKTCATVQVPFQYAYLLSLLIHFNNILLAVSSGFSFASAIEDVKAARKEAAQGDSRSETMQALGVVYKAFEVLWTQMTILVLIPLMYQSFMGIAHVLNRPFGNKIYHIPSETFIQILREELQVMNEGFTQERWNRKNKSSMSVLPEDSEDDALECGDAHNEGEDQEGEDGV